MFLASKIVSAGIVFTFLTTGISGPRPTPLASRPPLSKEELVATHESVKQMQQSLRDKRHYRGKVDGVIGLRTRASIRAYQKAENLPVTGQLDSQTAGKLGVGPEGREETGYETKGKPSAGIKWAKGTGRASTKPRKEVSGAAGPETDRRERDNKQEAENEKHPQ
jgi:peptidoglycan hydrolase-like protein with peptidoglycan-binding domain